MPTAPSFFAESEVASWTTNDVTKTVGMGLSAGDIVLVTTVALDWTTDVAPGYNPTLTFVLVDSHTPIAGFTNTKVYKATVSSSASYTIEFGITGGQDKWGFSAQVFTAYTGVGATAKAQQSSGSGEVSLITEWTNSALVYVQGDKNAVAITGRTWRTVNVTPTAANGMERVAFRQSGAYAGYGAYYSSVSTAGAKSPGLTAPTGQAWSAIAVEVKGIPDTLNGAAALSGSGTVTAVGTVERLGAATLTADAALTAAAEVVPRPYDQHWTGRQVFASTVLRDYWAERVTDWLQATLDTQPHPDPGGVFGTGVSVHDALTVAESTGPGITWSARIAAYRSLDAQLLGYLASEVAVESETTTADIEE